MITPANVEAFIAECGNRGVSTNIGGSILHTEGNCFSLPVVELKFDSFGRGKSARQYGVAVLESGEVVSVKQLATVDGLNLAGNFKQRLIQLGTMTGTYVVSSVKKEPRTGRDGKTFTAYTVKVEVK